MSRTKESPRRELLQVALILLILPLVLPLALLVLTLGILYRAAIWLLIQVWWLPRGKDILLVYSDSPIWRDYMTQEILPLVQRRAVILNWSERRHWHSWSLGGMALRSYGGRREFNPIVLLFPPVGRARVYRFWQAFQDRKHSYPGPLERLKQELVSAL
jgi:hypothetical protein